MKILLAIDASHASQSVICEAATRPWPSGTEFCVLHVVDITGMGRFAGLIEESKRAGQALVEAAADRLVRADRKTITEVLVGFTRKTVVQYAREWGADFVMVGSHTRGAVARFLLGSVARAVLHSAPCSVEIVRNKTEKRPGAGRGFRIIFGTDGSECAAAAAASIAIRPWPAGTEVHVISAVDLLIPGCEMSESVSCPVYPASLLEEIWSESRRKACDAVQAARKKLVAAGIEVGGGESTPMGDARDVLLNHAREWDADLIVLGSHGRSGLDLILLGSVSESVAQHAPCSVEIIRNSRAAKAGGS